LRAMSPDFETPVFYFKPYPGSPITEDAVRAGYVLPRDLDEWSRFDFIGSARPWGGPEEPPLGERLKVYPRLGWTPPPPSARPPLGPSRPRPRPLAPAAGLLRPAGGEADRRLALAAGGDVVTTIDQDFGLRATCIEG